MFPLVLIIALLSCFYCSFAMSGTSKDQTQTASGTRQLLCGQHSIYNDNRPILSTLLCIIRRFAKKTAVMVLRGDAFSASAGFG
jgi:hypothetical protein